MSSLRVAVVVATFVAVCHATPPIYVDSLHGSDGNSGASPAAALASITAAQSAARKVLAAGPLADDLNVLIAPGDYALSATLTLDASDSGSAGHFVHWQARDAPAPGAAAGGVRIHGAARLSKWTNVTSTRAAAASLSGGGDCAADHGSSTPCCGQRGDPVPSRYQCPADSPVCEDYVYDSHYGTCTGAAPPIDLWEADVTGVEGAQNRHIWVDGKRAPRTRLDGSSRAALFSGSTANDDGFQLAAGAASQIALSWPARGHGVEFVYPQQGAGWTEARCAVDNVTQSASADGGTAVFVYMMQPCYTNLRNKPCGQGVSGAPNVVENVGKRAIAAAGEWALDTSSKKVVLALPAGHSPADAVIEMPVLETLLASGGTAGSPAHNVRFSNVSFELATWLRPGQGDGYVEQQSGACILGTGAHNADCNYDQFWYKSPGNVLLRGISHFEFLGVEFSRLGGNGLDLGGGAHNNLVDGCYFRDISGAAVQIGDFEHFNATDPRDQDIGNVVSNTFVNKAAAEFSGAVGISVGYTANTSIVHCDVHNATYGAISVGWGWSRKPLTYARDTLIAYNRVHDYKQTLNDGGGIYMLGPQNGSKIHDNYVYHQGTASSGALYPDEGSAYSEFYHNVVEDIGSSVWLHLWNPSIHDIPVRDNFADTSRVTNHGTNCPMINNTVYAPGQRLAAAQAIVDAAGVPPGATRFVDAF